MRGPNLSELGVRAPSVTLFLILALVGAGLFAFLRLGRAEDPSFTIKVATVSAAWPGATAREMQDQVADRLEKRIQELAWYAGLRTTMLVSLAAALATALADALRTTHGKTPGDFATMDVMRMPLGILTGVGFLGAVAILKKGKLVMGLTTAATLWAVTVIGIVFGAGAYALGLAATVLCFGALYGLKFLDARFAQQHDGTLTLITQGSEVPDGWAEALRGAPCRAKLLRRGFDVETLRLTSAFKLSWDGPQDAEPPTALLRAALDLPGIVSADLQVEEASD